MKKIIGINSSPRLKGQASKLLDISLKAASLQGVKTEKIDLY
ncbi:MAG: flavodoxin family protein, partial [Thermoprotei archaeon]